MSLPEYPHFTLTEVAPGVWAALAGDTGACISNAAVIDLGDRTLVFDTFQTVRAAGDLRHAAEALTGRGAALTVISHWHGDHTGGAQVFDDAPIVATARTCELVAGEDPGDLDAYTAELDGYLETVRNQRDGAEDDAQRERAERNLQVLTLLREEAPGFRFTVPAPIDGDGMSFEGSERRVEMVSYGVGHTESDLFAHVPDAGVIVAGDLLWVGHHPRVNDGDALAWAAVLDRIGGLGPSAYVPGHGPVGGKADADYLGGYLRTVHELVDEAITLGLDAEAIGAIPVPAGSEAWGSVGRFHGSLASLAGTDS
ncbi:MAG: MBL fold metallo-hydrolase [Actinobacteria bacterium]|nr:MBL fold metallo-hydrolase [Actinomycetota bacterium]